MASLLGARPLRNSTIVANGSYRPFVRTRGAAAALGERGLSAAPGKDFPVAAAGPFQRGRAWRNATWLR